MSVTISPVQYAERYEPRAWMFTIRAGDVARHFRYHREDEARREHVKWSGSAT